MESMRVPPKNLVQPLTPLGSISAETDKAATKPASESVALGRKFVESRPGDILAKVTNRIRALFQSLRQKPAVKTPPPLPDAHAPTPLPASKTPPPLPAGPKPPLVDRRLSSQSQVTERQSFPPRRPPPAPPNQAGQMTARESLAARRPPPAPPNKPGAVLNQQPIPQRRYTAPSQANARPERRIPPAKPLPPIPNVDQAFKRSSVGMAVASFKQAKAEQLHELPRLGGMTQEKTESSSVKEGRTEGHIAPQFTPKTEIDAVPSHEVDKLASLAKEDPVNQKLAKEIAKNLRREVDALYKDLDIKKMLEKNVGIKGQVPSFDALADYSANVSNSISKHILAEEKVDKRAALISFYAQVGKNACEMGDFCTGMAIHSALTYGPIQRLKQTEKALSSQGKRSLNYLHNTFNPNTNFKNMRKAMEKYRKPFFFGKSREPLPSPTILAKDVTFGSESKDEQKRLEILKGIISPIETIKRAASLPPAPNSATILKFFSFEDTEDVKHFIQENIKKLEVQAREFNLPAAKVKTRDEHLLDYMQSLSLQREPRK